MYLASINLKLLLAHDKVYIQFTNQKYVDNSAKVESLLEQLNASDKLEEVINSRGTVDSEDGFTAIDLSSLEIEKIPKGLFKGLESTERLYLNQNLLSSLASDAFSDLPKLKFLSLYANNLKELPDDIFASLPNLEWLDLRENGLVTIPKSVGTLKNLVYLYLQNNADLDDDKNNFNQDYHSKRDVDKFMEAFTGEVAKPKKKPVRKAPAKPAEKTEATAAKPAKKVPAKAAAKKTTKKIPEQDDSS
ncbi:MAG: leucine-rich repeat domain-containing protein [Candidatus Heimdallarchaeota archaeon]|nr:leucine-rich repeat domain-containing protein [Candidatus Heimdallarchaeota archaeon]